MQATIITTLATATLAANPQFPVAWNADSASKLILWQGGTKTPTGACCSKTATQCKVQAQGQSGMAYTDGPNNRTALIAGGQGIFNFYKGNPSGKTMQFSAVQNGTTWQCQEYCPFEQGEDEYFNPLAFDPSATDQGKVTVENKTYESYHWFDTLFKVVKMDEQLWYVDESGTKPVPFQNIEKLTPFGQAEIAEMTAAWDSFTEGVDASIFKVSGLASCEESSNCGSNNKVGAGIMGRNAVPSIKDKKNQKFLDIAQQMKNAGKIPTVPRVEGHPVKKSTWSNDWSAQETSAMLINQGGQPNKAGDAICCDSSYGAQCQIQQQYSSGMRYYDYTNNRTRMEDPINGIEVVDYNSHKDMLVVHNGTHDVCQKYCPIDPRDTMDAGRDIFLDTNATDMGSTTYEKHTAEHWQWKETILKVITMSTTDFYADISGSSVLPLGEVQTLTPFGGAAIGQSTASWTVFKAGAQPASKFDIQGMDTCPQDPQCGQNSRQLQRLALKNMHTFHNYLEKM